MQRKRVLLYYSKFNRGGAEKSNLRLIKKMLETGWSVDLLLRYGGGDLEKEVPKEVKIIYYRGNYDCVKKLGSNRISERMMGIALLPLSLINQKIVENRLKKIQYDIAIVGLQGLDAGVIAYKTNADLKLLWIRNDLKNCDPDGRVRRNILKYEDKIDFYPCVSKSSLESFQAAFPDMADRARLFYNILNINEMKEKAMEASCIDGKYNNALKVVTVCRISDKSKGVFRMLDIYEKIRKEGIFFYWIVAGEGSDMSELKKMVYEKKLEDGFILVGNQENPYPLYQRCDIAAIFSYYEGLSGVVNEAKALGLPVVATEFSGIHEQIVSGENGLIVDNTLEGAYEGLKMLLTDDELRLSLTNNIMNREIADDDYKLMLFDTMFCDKINYIK